MTMQTPRFFNGSRAMHECPALRTGAVRLVSAFALLLCTMIPAGASGPAPGDIPGSLGDGSKVWAFDPRVDANEMDLFVTNFGSYGFDFENGQPGLIYPAGSGLTVADMGGIWIGGLVGGELRVSVSGLFTFEFQPGQIVSPGVWTDPFDPANRVYKLTPDSGPGDADYDEWPVGQGAPLGADGLPLRAGDQTLFSVFHDANPDRHFAGNGATEPIGIEVRHLTYAYDLPGAMGRVVVMEMELEHKGTLPVEDAFVGLALDPGIGASDDDVSGAASKFAATFAYNGTEADEAYGSDPPAVGLAILGGPTRIHSAVDWAAPDDPVSAQESYNYMRGLDRNGDPVIDPVTGFPTRFWHSGDPVTGGGWIDTDPADKRQLVAMGPFTFAPGDVETVRFAVVVGQGPNRIASAGDLMDALATVRELNVKKVFPSRARWVAGGAYPSTFCSVEGTELYLVAPRAGVIGLRVMNASRQIVRTLAAGLPVEPGILPLAWDGLGDDGYPVAPGRYQILLNVAGSGGPVGALVSDRSLVDVFCGDEEGGGDGASPPAGDLSPLASSPARLHVPGVVRGGAWIAVGDDSPSDLAAPAPADALVDIFNVRGQRVRRLHVDGTEQIWWDGRDGSGRALPAGLYLLRASRGHDVATARVMVLK